MSARPPVGYRELQSPSLYRKWQQPLFGSSAPRHTPNPLRVLVWTDDAPAIGSQLNFDVIRHDGTTVEAIAEVTWVGRQSAEHPARFRLGLEVFPQTEPNQEELERLLAD